MRKPARSPIIAAAVAAMIACGTAQNGATDFAVRDSAGIRIVENAESSGEVRRDLVEELRIGVIAGEEPYQLDRVLDVTVDERGRIYVANNGSLTIRVYNATGQFLHEVGGRGNGPGEFARMINDVWVEDDTVFGVDWQSSARVNAYAPDGSPVGTWSFRGPNWRSAPLAGSTREWIGPYHGSPAQQAGETVSHVPLVRGHPDTGDPAATIIELPRRPLFRSGGTGEGAYDWPLFTVEPAYVVTPRLIVFHAGDAHEYRVADRSGTLLMIVRRAWSPVPVDDAMLQRYRDLQAAFYDSLAAAAPDEHRRDDVRMQRLSAEQRTERQLALPRPETVPPLGRLVSGHEGAVWIERRDLGDVAAEQFNAMYGGLFRNAPTGRSRWDAFAPDGRFLGTVELPARFAAYHATSSSVTGVLTDELGVEYVVRYGVSFGS